MQIHLEETHDATIFIIPNVAVFVVSSFLYKRKCWLSASNDIHALSALLIKQLLFWHVYAYLVVPGEIFHGPHHHPRCCRQRVFLLSFDDKTVAGLSMMVVS
ncbi:predicted protein [Lichtheimia corymbifera JMRC:FSU:9682]|uniref:Uncharacterized protein n=1 Tax=Lichtheimia corymbifera JMRC:FSU:9682 TaxID=1263082 RepID=A0A068RFV2_9FUNG|nr:predicted protein [Lichtheimia corymbifera JMRC:FSU:9682]